MTEQDVTQMNELKKQVDLLWDDIVALNNDSIALGKDLVALAMEYLGFYEDAFLSGEPNAHTRIKELYKQKELPF
jgi:hypothetical protein